MSNLNARQTFVWTQHHSYLISYDHASGHTDRYTVYALAETEDPVIIGRELPWDYIQTYLREFDALAALLVTGPRWERRQIHKVCKERSQGYLHTPC